MADESIPVRSSSQKADEKTAAKGATAPESTAADVGTTEPAADAAKDTEMKDTEEKPADETKTEKESVAEGELTLVRPMHKLAWSRCKRDFPFAQTMVPA